MKKLLIVIVIITLSGCSSYKNEMIEFTKPICTEYIAYVKADKSLTPRQKEVKILKAEVVLDEQVTE